MSLKFAIAPSRRRTGTMPMAWHGSCRPVGTRRIRSRAGLSWDPSGSERSGPGRAQLVKIKCDLENQIRGLIENLGLVTGKAGGQTDRLQETRREYHGEHEISPRAGEQPGLSGDMRKFEAGSCSLTAAMGPASPPRRSVNGFEELPDGIIDVQGAFARHRPVSG